MMEKRRVIGLSLTLYLFFLILGLCMANKGYSSQFHVGADFTKEINSMTLNQTKSAAIGDIVNINYQRYRADSTPLDGGPLVIYLDDGPIPTSLASQYDALLVIHGFWKAITGGNGTGGHDYGDAMKEGDKKEWVIIPPEDGYSTGELAGITLYFDIELVGILYDANNGSSIPVNITIDGKMDDWYNITPFLDNTTNKIGSYDLDIIWLVNDGEYLYFHLFYTNTVDSFAYANVTCRLENGTTCLFSAWVDYQGTNNTGDVLVTDARGLFDSITDGLFFVNLPGAAAAEFFNTTIDIEFRIPLEVLGQPKSLDVVFWHDITRQAHEGYLIYNVEEGVNNTQHSTNTVESESTTVIPGFGLLSIALSLAIFAKWSFYRRKKDI